MLLQIQITPVAITGRVSRLHVMVLIQADSLNGAILGSSAHKVGICSLATPVTLICLVFDRPVSIAASFELIISIKMHPISRAPHVVPPATPYR